MTAQRDLGLVWALNGGATDPGSTKYENGWVAEIPTYQNFNYAMQTLDGNILHLAENVAFTWDALITYSPGARVVGSNGNNYTCIATTTNNNPTTDNGTYWVNAYIIGTNYSVAKNGEILRVDGPQRGNANWSTMDIVVENRIPMIELRDDANTGTDNLAIGNNLGELVVSNLGTSTPDGRDLSKDGSYTSRIFHEGHLPTAAEVVGGVEEAPTGGALYARVGLTAESGQWVPVTSTTVATTPPTAVGTGTGWYNLTDGQFYIDIDDGNSSQWVPASPTNVPARAQFRVNSTGASTSQIPSGWTTSRTGNTITVTHNTGTQIWPTAAVVSSSAKIATVDTVGSNSFEVKVWTDAGADDGTTSQVVISVDY